MEELIRLRHELHRNPELSGFERATAKRLRFFLNGYKPDELYSNIAGEGMAAVFNSHQPGPTLLFRCDMDALPVQETSEVKYKSSVPGVGHVCGHDGHMAIVSGLAVKLNAQRITKGRVILFYQPSEENGVGAKQSIVRLKDLDLIPDFAIALHGMPKYPMGSIVLGKPTFSAASKGIIIKLFGKNSHAAFPESGLNPAPAVADIIQGMIGLKASTTFKDFVLVTLIYARLGEVAFGTSPGYAEIMATLRAFDDSDMAILSDKAVSMAELIAHKYGLRIEIAFADDYPASVCNPELSSAVEQLAEQQGRKVSYLEHPNRWSEDFAHFTAEFPSIIFGLGLGEDHPDIHTPDFDFPDKVIEDGIALFDGIIRKYLE